MTAEIESLRRDITKLRDAVIGLAGGQPWALDKDGFPVIVTGHTGAQTGELSPNQHHSPMSPEQEKAVENARRDIESIHEAIGERGLLNQTAKIQQLCRNALGQLKRLESERQSLGDPVPL